MFRQWMFTEARHGGDRPAFGGGCQGRGHDRERSRFGGGHHHEHFERAFRGGGRERMFDGGDLQLIILQQLAEKPSYGYELIKAIEERMAGGYAPSPGVVYPTLTLLEERGFARVESTEGNRKTYAVTDEGRKELETNAARLRDIGARVDQSGRRFRRGRSPEIMRAFLELRGAIMRSATRGKSSGDGFTPEQIKKITEAIETAAQAIDAI